MKIHVVVPTFRESGLVPAFLESWAGIVDHEIEIYLVNGNPGDDTSQLVSAWSGRCRVREIQGSPDLFWTGLVCLGLRAVADTAGEEEAFVLTNIDVKFDGDPVSAMLGRVDDWKSRQITLPVIGAEGKALSAGVQVRSWALSLNRHLYDGVPQDELPGEELTEVTYLPTRLVLIPAKALGEGHFPDEKQLPHYCADYEYTNRLRLHGYLPCIVTGAAAEIAQDNTGFDTYLRPTSFLSRLARIADIKCAYNFRYRFHFVRLTYPGFAVVPGMITHFAKIFLEILFGGKQIDRLRSR
jgi:GT2 family glycosyltransferase